MGGVKNLQPTFKLGDKSSSMPQKFLDWISGHQRHANWEKVFDLEEDKNCALDYIFWDVQFGQVLLNKSIPLPCYYSMDGDHNPVDEKTDLSYDRVVEMFHVQTLSWANQKQMGNDHIVVKCLCQPTLLKYEGQADITNIAIRGTLEHLYKQ